MENETRSENVFANHTTNDIVTHNSNITLSDVDIQWHPAFCAATELELLANKSDLDFLREYNLNKKPLQIDLMVVKKLDNVNIENEFGHIFKKHNVLEFKSPGDGMTIDDFFKVIGYALQYKSMGKTVDEIPIDQLTISMVREAKPAEMFRSLKKYGFAVEERFDGIYYVEGTLIPAQVIVTKELNGENHRSLKVLSRNPKTEDILAFVENAKELTEQGDRVNVDTVLQVSASANLKLYIELMRRYPDMSEAMKILMHDQLEEAAMNVKRETALKMKSKGYSDNTIADLLEVGTNIIQKWFTEYSSVAK